MTGFFSTEVVGGEKAINRVLVNTISTRINKLLDSSLGDVKVAVGEVIRNAILDSAEYTEVTSGDEWHELGIPNPVGAFNAIIAQIQQSVSVKRGAGPKSGELEWEFLIGILRADYSDILGLTEASFYTYTRDGRTVIKNHVEWLRWLLTTGGEIAVSRWSYWAEPSPKSRTGLGLMKKDGGSWRVPASVAGTPSDNILTRILNRNIDAIHNAIISTVNQAL